MELEQPILEKDESKWLICSNLNVLPRKDLRPLCFYINSRTSNDFLDFDTNTLEENGLDEHFKD